jgi:hypothetical protein
MLLVLVGKATRQIVQCAQTFQLWVESREKNHSQLGEKMILSALMRVNERNT